MLDATETIACNLSDFYWCFNVVLSPFRNSLFQSKIQSFTLQAQIFVHNPNSIEIIEFESEQSETNNNNNNNNNNNKRRKKKKEKLFFF